MGFKIDYTYCPQCRRPLAPLDGHPHCSACDITIYDNVAVGAGVLLVRDNKVLLVRRGIDPYKGSYDIVGGFVNPGETPEQAAIREAKEETGLDVEIVELLGTYSDRYGEGAHTLGLHYLAKIVGGIEQAGDDAASLEWVEVTHIPEEAFTAGFKNTADTLRDLQKRYHA